MTALPQHPFIPMKVIVGCEESQVVCAEFRARGHEAFSCDKKPTRGNPIWHYQCDVREVLGLGWDLGIFHPDCTYLTSSAEWAYGAGPYHQKVKPTTLVGAARRSAREEAIIFFRSLMECDIPHVGSENPTGCLSSRYRKPDQIIQPYQFGDDASKATCLWLKSLPPLTHTKYIAPRMVNGKPRWSNQTDSGQNKLSPGDNRARDRSVTYTGIAQAMADQWGCLKTGPIRPFQPINPNLRTNE